MNVAPIALTLVAALFATPSGVEAQVPEKVYRLGVLTSTFPREQHQMLQLILNELGERGFREGKNLLVEHRNAAGRLEQLDILAGELLRTNPDIIYAEAPPAVQAAKGATQTVPIVMVAGDDPVRAGLVSSLARPGGNVTGVALLLTDLSGKRLELLKTAVPKTRRVAVLVNPANLASRLRLPELNAAAKSLGMQMTIVEVLSPHELDNAFAAIRKAGSDAVLTMPDPMFFRERLRIGEFALKARLPLVSDWREMAEAGAAIAYGPNFSTAASRIASYIDRILKGASPALLPIEQPKEVDLVINRKTANSLRLKIPQSLLILANVVIE